MVRGGSAPTLDAIRRQNMPGRRTNVAGATVADRRLWNTYMFWARSSVAESIPPELDMADDRNRLSATRARSLQAILFSCFMLEYRLRRVYEVLGLQTRKRDTIWALLDSMPSRLSAVRSLNRTKIRLPAEWARIRKRLQHLLELRNVIAHGRYAEVKSLLRKRPSRLVAEACRGYNAVIDAVRILNVAIGAETLRGTELRRYYRRLKAK